MPGDKDVFVLQVVWDDQVDIPTCEGADGLYHISVHPDGVKSKIMDPFFKSVMNAYADYRLSKPDSVIVNFAWTKDDCPEKCDPFQAAHIILRAIDKTKPGPIYASLLLEKVDVANFWKFLPSLPQSIETITLGLCDPDVGEIPANVWASLPRLQTIKIHTSRTEDGKIGPEITFERPKAAHPRDDEPEEPSKRTRTDAIDFATSTAKAFVVLPDDDDERAETFSIMLDPEEGDEFVFRAIPHEKVPREGAHKLLGCSFERVRVAKDMAKFFKPFAFVDAEGKMRDAPKFNNNASAITGTTFSDPLFGRVVFVKK